MYKTIIFSIGSTNIKKDISKLNIGSVSPNDVLLIKRIIFEVNIFPIKRLSIAEKTSVIDLFGNFGISFFSSIKKSFSPFFILLPVKYIIIKINIKFIPITLYLIFSLVKKVFK